MDARLKTMLRDALEIVADSGVEFVFGASFISSDPEHVLAFIESRQKFWAEREREQLEAE